MLIWSFRRIKQLKQLSYWNIRSFSNIFLNLDGKKIRKNRRNNHDDNDDNHKS